MGEAILIIAFILIIFNFMGYLPQALAFLATIALVFGSIFVLLIYLGSKETPNWETPEYTNQLKEQQRQWEENVRRWEEEDNHAHSRRR